jgi:hypothetical protein
MPWLALVVIFLVFPCVARMTGACPHTYTLVQMGSLELFAGVAPQTILSISTYVVTRIIG